MSGFFHYERCHGALLVAPERTRFRLWAPSCASVTLEREGFEPVRMTAQPDGWFLCEVASGAGVRYRYRVNAELSVPDPASCAQPDDVHGPSQVVDPFSYDWKCLNWNGRPWQETVIYEVHVGLCGGYRKLAEDLPRLAALGVTAIELMPLSEFPGGRNWGYDGVFPFAPESAYGTPDDLKFLVDQAHAHDLMIFLDVVYNHFGPDGNYIATYAEDFFAEGEKTPWGDAIDFTRRQVRDYFIDNALYWIMEFRFDGLRLDAVQAIIDRSWLEEVREAVAATVEEGRFVHLILENENNDAALLREGFRAQWNDDAHNALHVLLTREHEGYYGNFSENPMGALKTVLEQGFFFQGQISPVTGEPRGSASGDLASDQFVFFLQNHDQTGNRAMGDRLMTLADPGALHVAHVLLLLNPQIPMLFFGEEWGCQTPFFFFTSHAPDLASMVKEGRRAEFASFSAFHSAEQRAHIPDPNAEETFDRSRPDRSDMLRPEHQRWLELTSSLLDLRRRYLVPRLANTHSAGACVLGRKGEDNDGSGTGILAHWRMGDGALLTIAFNLAGQAVLLPETPVGEVIFAWPMTPAGQELTGWSIAVWLKENSHV